MSQRWAALLAVLACAVAACGREPPRTIVLIGGIGSEGPARHDYADGMRLLADFLHDLPEARRFRVESHPDGWPSDPHAFDDAATLVLYLDGDAKQPLLDPTRRRMFETLMRRGTGLVALHQASTVPAGDVSIDLPRWLGAARYGLYDRTTESATLRPAAAAHPVLRGVRPFTYRDEFYPTFRYAPGATPLLRAMLHPQYRDGHALIEDRAEDVPVAWAFERPNGGRSFGYSGGHYLVALDQPMLRRLLLNAILWTADVEVPPGGTAVDAAPDAAARIAARREAAVPAAPEPPRLDVPTFHHDARRSGWNPEETELTPASVSSPAFGLLWESPPLDAVDGEPPRLYASPLYLGRLTITAGEHRGEHFAAAIVASSNGYVYAINTAKAGDVAPGRILWRTRLAAPCHLQPAPLDGVPTGVLSTPVADVARDRLYVTHCDPQGRWQAYALDLGSGAVLPGWPVRLDEPRLNAVNRNAGPHPVPPTRRFDFRVQRGALNLSPDGKHLYVVFGETETGWLVSVDTVHPQVDSAFAAVAMPHRGSGGIWGAGGPAVDTDGSIYVATGTGFDGYRDQPHDWTQSVLKLSDRADEGLHLVGTYTPFNYCATAKMDIDLGSGGIALLPALDPAATATPRLLAVGGKQGNAYLLDRDHLPGRLDRRPRCSTDAATDGSLLPPSRQPPFAGRGPLNVFGPYSDEDAALDTARARSVPAAFRAADGTDYLYFTGNTRAAMGSSRAVPPSLVRLRVTTKPGRPAWLTVDRRQPTVAFGNPGSPVVSSDGAHDAIVWVMDENAPRSALLVGEGAPAPVLYAFDADSLAPLWHSRPGELSSGGKYDEPVVVRGLVLVGTDRLQAFGLGAVHTKHVPAVASVAAVPVATDSGLDGAALFARHCAVCHDHPQGNVPPHALIARRPRADIVQALTRGAMRAQAAGLGARDIDALADYLTGKTP